jgi:hypothetical protein
VSALAVQVRHGAAARARPPLRRRRTHRVRRRAGRDGHRHGPYTIAPQRRRGARKRGQRARCPVSTYEVHSRTTDATATSHHRPSGEPPRRTHRRHDPDPTGKFPSANRRKQGSPRHLRLPIHAECKLGNFRRPPPTP